MFNLTCIFLKRTGYKTSSFRFVPSYHMPSWRLVNAGNWMPQVRKAEWLSIPLKLCKTLSWSALVYSGPMMIKFLKGRWQAYHLATGSSTVLIRDIWDYCYHVADFEIKRGGRSFGVDAEDHAWGRKCIALDVANKFESGGGSTEKRTDMWVTRVLETRNVYNCLNLCTFETKLYLEYVS